MFKKCSDLFLGHFKSVSKYLDVFKSVPKHFDLLSRLSYFHNVSKLSVYSETFRFVLGTFQKFCGTLRRFQMFRNFQFTPKHSDLFWGQFKIVLENVLEKFQDCSENIQIYFQDISKVFWNIKMLLV